MSTYARIALAKQRIAEKNDQLVDNGHYKMTKQVSHRDTPTTSQLPRKFAASPPQIHSPTSAPLHSKTSPKASRVPPRANSLVPTQQLEATFDASVHNALHTPRLTPTEQLEKVLNEDLEAKRKVEVKRAGQS